MTDYDPQIAAVLDRVLPMASDEGDWASVMRDVRDPQRRRRSMLALRRRPRMVVALAVMVVVGALIAIPALATAKDWWFLGTDPTPESPIALITSGETAGETWYLTAFVSEEHGICVAVTLDPVTTGVMSCGMAVRGAPPPRSGDTTDRAIGTARTVWPLERSAGTSFVYGATADNVARVDLERANGGPISVETLAAPDLDVPLRFYIVELPLNEDIVALVARDADGTVIERFPLRQ